MPRGLKSKLRAREKRRQVRIEARPNQCAQATEAEEEEEPSSSSHVPCTKSDEGSNSGDGERPSTSQASSTPGQSAKEKIEDLAILMVQFMLKKYSTGESITKKEMVKHVIPDNKELFAEILDKASELMVLAFGIDVKQVDPSTHCYVLVSKLNLSSATMLNGEAIMPKSGLLLTILCVIFIRGNRASEENVWEVLNVMGIYAGTNHFIYGDVKKLITQDLVRERYLEYRHVPNSDPPRYQFLWGPRAHIETSKMKVLEFLAKIHNTVPSAFPSWYEEALRDEEERARATMVALLVTRAIGSARSRGHSSRPSHPY
uniref:melanoma-associated antigen B10-like n=1 Tax=Jaculus jaculus TaxID=51337 RepID=UPI000332F4D8|nr:melanoma-associated antigen B10-like [Jaculus jaculus]